MVMLDQPQPPGARQRQYGGPEARIHYLVFRDFETMDTQQSRVGLAPNLLAWLENLQPVGKNNLSQVPGPALSPLTTVVGKSIYRQYYATYGGNDYSINFFTDGSAYQINLAGGAQTQIAPAATFSNPDMAQWASDRILIVDPSAGYCTWDGSVLVKPGGVSPSIKITNGGSGYSSVPSVNITGGSGSGATAVAIVQSGSVVAVTLTAAGSGYKAGDVLTVVFGGPGTSAAATAIVFPILTIPNMTTLAVFQGRVWIAGNRTLLWTGSAGFDDVSAANASGSSILSDSDLPHRITALRALNNFLYIFGDGSIKQIGTIAVSSGVTLFTIVTLSSDQGTIFLNSIVAYNRLVLFANFNGVFAIFGATIEKVSDPMDGLYRTIDFTLSPIAVTTDVNNIRCFLLLVRILDPVNGPRSVFFTFMNRKWFLISQGAGVISSAILTAIGAVINGVTQIFTSSGADITQVLASATSPTAITVRTALSDDQAPMKNKRAIRIGIAQQGPTLGTMLVTTDSETSSVGDQYAFALPVTWVNNSGQAVQFVNNLSQAVNFVSGGFLFQYRQGNASGIYLGASFFGTFSQLTLNSIVIEYEDGPMMRSVNHG